MYGSAARAPRRGGGIMKIFHWEGEPQRELDTATTTSFRILQLIIRSTAFTTSGVPPSSRTAYDYSTRHLHLHGDQTNRIRPGKSIMSLSFPTLPEQPGLTTRYSALLYTSHLLLEVGIGDPGWGPGTRHLDFFFMSRCSFGVEIMLQAGGP